MADDFSNSTNIKGKDWFFNCLWAAARDLTAAKCPITIPLTFIFREGQPVKALATDPSTRVVDRVSMEGYTFEREAGDGNDLRGEHNRYLRILRKMLFEYSRENEYDKVQESGEKMMLCTVYYADGEKEHIDVYTFDILIRNDSWRQQVLIVQGFVPAISVQQGTFYDKPKVRSLLESERAVAADKYTAAMSKFVEKAYTFSSGTMLDDIGAKVRDLKEVKLKVKEMLCNFVLDPKNRVICTVCESAMVEIFGARQQVEDYMHKEKVSRESSAADSVTRELQKLLRHAARRGLPPIESFRHFDRSSCGYVDADMLLDGLARLGIGVVYTVAEGVLKNIAGIGSGFITFEDFERYLQRTNDANDFDDEMTESTNSQTSTTQKKKKNGKSVTSKSSDGLSTPAGVVSEKDILPLKVSQASVSTVLKGSIDESLYQVPQDSKGQRSPRGREEGYLSGGKAGTIFGADEKKSSSTLHRNDADMSSLSSRRQRSALREIRRAHDNWTKKKEDESAELASVSEEENLTKPSVPPSKDKTLHNNAMSKGSGKSTVQSSSNQSSKKGLKPLNLQGIYTEMQASHSTSQSADDVLHVDSGVIMTYRLILGQGVRNNKTQEETPNLKYKSILEVREKNLAELEAERLQEDQASGDFAYINSVSNRDSFSIPSESEASIDRFLSFTLVIIPDLFMTLDTLQKAFDPILTKYPHSRVILVGIPGLPNTHWPKGWVLNSDLHARSIAKLFIFLRDKRQLQLSPGAPIFMMGCGSGSICMTRFISMYLPGIPSVYPFVKAAIFVSGLIKLSNSFKNTSKELRLALMKAGSHEVNELVCSLHFWDQYLVTNDRDECMKNFWKSRRELCSDHTDPEHAGLGYVGVLELLRGYLLEPECNDDVTLLDMELPLFIVQATEDVFVNPKNAIRFSAEKLPKSRKLVSDLDCALEDGSVHISWLKSGHEVIQERGPYLLALVSKLAQMCGIHPKSQDAWDEVPVVEEEEVFDILELAARRRKAEEDARIVEEERVKAALEAERRAHLSAEALKKELDDERLRQEELARIKRIEDERKRMEELAQLEAEELKLRLEQEVAEAEAARLAAIKEEEAARERRALDKEKRNELARERKKRELVAARMKEMEVLYERERVAKELKFEYMQKLKMEKEDNRSRKAWEYATLLEQISNSKIKAKKRQEMLEALKREEAIKAVEEKLSLKKAERLEARRRKAMEVVKQIEAEEFKLGVGDEEPSYELTGDERDPVSAILISTQRMLQDYHIVRERMAEVMKRQILVEEKTNLFIAQCESAKHDCARLNRAIQMIKCNPSALSTTLDVTKEIEDLQRNLSYKEDSYKELTGLRKGREAQLSAANRAVQKMKTTVSDYDNKVADRMEEIYRMENVALQKIKEFKEEQHDIKQNIDKIKYEMIIVQKRIKIVDKEYARIRAVKEPTVDTAIWVEGVLQRVDTKALKDFLKKESKKEKAKIIEFDEAIMDGKEKMLAISIRQDKCRRDCDKLSMAAKIFGRTHKEIKDTPIRSLVDALSKKHADADKLENKRKIDTNLDKKSASLGAVTLVDKVRLKDSELRTKDERRFIGMDLILCPDAYMHLSMTEIEEMKFDPDYHCELTKADLLRISRLPDQVNLALPFLHTLDEVESHRIFNIFLKEIPESEFIQRDYKSDGFVAEPAENVGGVTGADLQDAEVIHDILVRESLRDHIRSKGEGEEFTEEERDWISIDKILSPHVYDLDEKLTDRITEPDVDGLLTSIYPRSLPGVYDASEDSHKTNQNHTLKASAENAQEYPITVPKIPNNRDGDMYQEIRWRYENGEIVFDDSWKCPFKKVELLHIHRTQIDLLQSEDEKRAKVLLNRFYVSEDESTLGKKRLENCLNLMKEVIQAVEIIDYDNPRYKKMRSVNASSDKKPVVQMERKVTRIWGAWDTVHPASAGLHSQSNLFLVSIFSASRDHPASYAVYEDSGSNLFGESSDPSIKSGGAKKNQPSGAALGALGRKALTSMPSQSSGPMDTFVNDPNSKFFIVDSIAELVMQEQRKVQGKIVLIAKGEQMTISEVKETTLESRQSRTHRFDLPNREDSRILDITVSVLFQGSFTSKGYGLGRLAAALFRLPDDNDPNASAVPHPVGFSPYVMQSPNLPDSMGRIVIMHRPHSRPIKPQSYQIVIGAASPTKYSIIVTCKVAQSALPLVDDAINKARQWQSRLPTCLQELETIGESLQIAERKLLVVDKMILEAELETKKLQNSIFGINKRLQEDDEFTTMLEDERKELVNELSITEVEFAQMSNTYGSRTRERDDVKEGILMMHNFQRERQHEKTRIKKDLEVARRELPQAILLLRSVFEAINIAASLNTTLVTPGGADTTSKKDSIPVILTPAEEVRKHLRRNGWKTLSLEEQQWCIMDQAMHPSKYEWLREKEDEENNIRIQRGKKPKKLKMSAAVEQYRLTKIEIEHILVQPFASLTKQEMIIRKLIRKYHDSPEIMKRKISETAYGFDPHIAERTRAKDPKAYTKDELEWTSIDRILHGEVWKFYSNFEHQKKKSTEDAPPAEVALTESRQKNAMDSVGRILHLDASVAAGANVAELASAAQHVLVKKATNYHAWQCPFTKDQILKIWKTPRQFLKTDDEILTLKHLLKFNGTYNAYMENIADSRARSQHATKAGQHIIWERGGGLPETDMDLRARAVLKETERAAMCKTEYMDTTVLHANSQRFPTVVLRTMLEEELDALLRAQVMERERSDRMRIIDIDDSDEDPDGVGSDESEFEEEGGDIMIMKKVHKRAAKREKRRLKLKQDDMKDQVQKAKKLVGLKNKSGEALEMARLQNELGINGCIACRARECKWVSSVDMEICNARLKELGEEINRVRADKDAMSFVSTVALSAQLGGNRHFQRLDLMAELNDEAHEIGRRVDLDNVDKELHDSYKTRSEYMEVKYLHGYTMMLWTNNARKALESRRARLIAVTIASDIVNDILDYMLEGWYFGETESNYSIAGKVPSIQKEGFIKSGQDQIDLGPRAAEKAKKRLDMKRQGIETSESRRGTQAEKLVDIEEDSKMDKVRLKVARDGNDHEHMLNETETTLRFGLFMLALMYFRAMTYLKREKKSWSGESDAVSDKKSDEKVMTDERMRMLDEESKAVARKKKVDVVLAKAKVGEARRLERERAERRDAIIRLQAIVKRQKLELDCIIVLQKVYRGHLGRKAARRWALKKAEIGALNALLNASAIFIQRIYRGYLARVEAINTRAQLAQFIALMRAQEAAEDEEQYWDTHPWSRFKKNAKAYIDTKFRQEHATKMMGASRLTAEEEAELAIEDAGDQDSGNESDDAKSDS